MISQVGENLHETNEDCFRLPSIKIEETNCDNSKISLGHSSANYSDHLRFKNTKIKTEIDCDLEMGGNSHDISSSSIGSIKTEPEDPVIIKHAMDEESDFTVGNYKIKLEEINIKEESSSCMDNDVGTNTSEYKHCSSHNLSLPLEHYISDYYNCNPHGLYSDSHSAYGPLEPDLELNKKDECEVEEYSYLSGSKTFKDGGFEVTDRLLGFSRKKGSISYFKKQYGRNPYKCICCSYSTCEKQLAIKHFNETHKIHGYIYVCTFCAYATNVKDCLMLHIQHKHKCKMLKCNICHHKETLTEFFTKHHKCKVDNSENMSPNKGKIGDGELKLDSANFDEITIEKTELDFDGDEIKQENNEEAPKMNIAKMFLSETNLTSINVDNKNGEVILDYTNVCHQEATLADFLISSHKYKIENTSLDTEKTSDIELELDSANFKSVFDDEIKIEETELDVDNEAKQETNKVVHEMNVTTTSLNQTYSSIISDGNENEGQVVLGNSNSVSDISKSISFVSAVGLNEAKKSLKKTHKIHVNTYVCTFCGYTTKEVNGLMSHMQYKHKCETLKCSKCHCETTLSEFVGKPHKCKVDNSKNIASNTEKTSDRELELDSANFDEITIEKTELELDVHSDAKQETNELVHEMNLATMSLDRSNGAKNSSKKTHKNNGNSYICMFCGYTTKDVNGLMSHMQYKHKCKTLKCSKCHCETTLSEFVGKPHKCKVHNSKNITSNTEKTSDRESEPLFYDEITIETTELDVKQVTNKVVHEMSLATMSLNQTNLSITSDDNKNEAEGVLGDRNSISFVLAIRLNEGKEHSKKTHKIHGHTYVCMFCDYTSKDANSLKSHIMQYKHKYRTSRCSTCDCEITLSEFDGKPHKCKVHNSENITSYTEKTSDRKLELNSANFEPLFDDKITIEKTELDVDSETKQETNKVVHEKNVATMSLNQKNLSILRDDNKNEAEGVLGDTNSISDISKPISFVSAIRLNENKEHTKKTHKIHGHTYTCTFCDYTTKEANGLKSHIMQYKQKCITSRCSTCHCETTLSEFDGKPHKCKVDHSKNITSNTEKTSDRELELDSANFEPLFDDQKTELDVDNEAKQETNKVVNETNVITTSLDQTNSNNVSIDNKNEGEVVLDVTNPVSDIPKLVSFVSTVRLNKAEKISNKMQKIRRNKYTVSEYDFFKCTYDKETQALTCTQCSFETKDRGCLRKHFEKEHGNKFYKCLICSFEVKQQRVLSNHYREKHNIREYLTKKVIERRTLKKKNNEESNKNEQNLTAEMDIEQTAECTENTVRKQNGVAKSLSKMQKVHSSTFICPFCGYTAKEVNGLISHMQHEHKYKTVKCNVLRQEATLTDSLIKSRKYNIENIPTDTEKTSERESKLGSANFETHFNDKITIENPELDVDSEAKQETNKVVNEMNVSTMSLDQTNSSIINKNEEKVVLGNTNSVSDICKPDSSVSAVRLNLAEESSKKTQKIHGNTYICTFCGYTTKEVNGLISHMQHKHKCKTLSCSKCNCEATLSEFLGKPHKCKVDNPRNSSSNTEKTDDRELNSDSTNLVSNAYDEITIEKSEFVIKNDLKQVLSSNTVSESDAKNYMFITATKEIQSQVRSSVNDIFKCTYDKETKTLTCTLCSFETKDRSCLRKHFKKKHGNKPYKCLMCSFKVKQQRTLSNHYREKHNIREYLTKKDIEKKTSKQKNSEESDEDEQDSTAEMDTEHTAEDNNIGTNGDLAADKEGTKNKTETSDSNGQSENEKWQHNIEITKSTLRKQPQIEEQTNESSLSQNKWEEFKCMDCDFKSDVLKEVVRHIGEVHNKTGVLDNVKSADVKLLSNLSLNIVICPYCELTLNEKTSLLEHIRKQHKSKEVLKCSQCNFKTKSEDGLKKHKACAHVLHSCPECDYKAKQRVCVRRHFSLYHPDKLYKCSECDFKTYDESVLSNHVHLEHDETTVIHKCNNCSYRTDNYIRFNKHRCRSHPEICLYRCVYCEFKSRSRHCLVKHLEKIHNEYFVK